MLAVMLARVTLVDVKTGSWNTTPRKSRLALAKETPFRVRAVGDVVTWIQLALVDLDATRLGIIGLVTRWTDTEEAAKCVVAAKASTRDALDALVDVCTATWHASPCPSIPTSTFEGPFRVSADGITIAPGDFVFALIDVNTFI
mmetsp:Transcript_41654/g.65010  ORF Transcript_41654/g.65010 Transcript_41654/m.65010 type:complete len:144 (+) Transcript_41654:249-680(+)